MSAETAENVIARTEPPPAETAAGPAFSTAGSPLQRALDDLWQGLLLYRFWGLLAWKDVRRHYRRSTLGPLWITFSMAIFIGLLGILYAQLFNRPLAIYIPHLTVGYTIWTMISSFVERGSKCFTAAEGIIKQTCAPLSVHAYRVVGLDIITFAHHAVLFIPVAIIFSVTPQPQWLLAIPGLILIVLTGTWVALLLGLICTRFRDIPEMIKSVMRVMFFLTPVIWHPDLVSRRAIFLTANPFYHYIELVRGPLLNKPIDPLHWYVAGAITFGGWLVTIAVYQRLRFRIPYWL
jgi:ABC-type polysaccharide/polyol phosphate export permease